MRRLECAAGEEVQVDFGVGAPVYTPEGKRRKTWVFRMVLSHSRKAYSEATFRQTTDDFLRCLENAFAHFGGVTKTVVIDNLRAAVKKPDWFDPELVPKLVSFCRHYGVVILPTRPRTPRHKGKVEAGVKYVKNNALKGRRFNSLADFKRLSGRSTATGTSRWARRTTLCRRSIWATPSGRGGTRGWCVCSTPASSRLPCMPGRSRAASARMAATWPCKKSCVS